MEATARRGWSPLLGEVAAAAGAVEMTYLRLLSSVGAVQSRVDEERIADGLRYGCPEVDEVWVAVADLLTWTRTVVDRTHRTRRVRGVVEERGLAVDVPAEDRDAVMTALGALGDRLGDARLWANASIHALALPHTYPTCLVRDEGETRSVEFWFPDEAKSSADTATPRTREQRDALRLAKQWWEAVDQFMEDVLLVAPRDRI
jgi:hypothetical protein